MRYGQMCKGRDKSNIKKYIICSLTIIVIMFNVVVYADGNVEFKNLNNMGINNSGNIIPSVSSYIDTKEATYIMGAKKYNLNSVDELPVSYDLRDSNNVSSVKDQGRDGVCWAFATYGSAESSYKVNNGVEFDFSENNMKHLTSIENGEWGFDRPSSGGGNRDIATAYLARLDGAVLEEDEPYVYGDELPAGITPERKPIAKTLNKAIFYPNITEFYNALDVNFRNMIKEGIIENGAIMTSLYSNSAYMNNTTNAFFYDGDETLGNHAITIVGWDDNYDIDNFSIANKPTENGAFICKNSRGESWGEDGYFYVSYEDKLFGIDSAAFIMNDIKKDLTVYQYDNLGMTNQMGFTGHTSQWYANKFSTKNENNERLAEIGFYMVRGGSYDIFINIGNDELATDNMVATGSVANRGYYTIDIEEPPIITGDNFSVIIKTTHNVSVNSSIIPIESKIKDYSSRAVASEGQSFVGVDGENWTDLTKLKNNGELIFQDSNVCIKAFTISTEEFVINTSKVTDDDNGNIELLLDIANNKNEAISNCLVVRLRNIIGNKLVDIKLNDLKLKELESVTLPFILNRNDINIADLEISVFALDSIINMKPIMGQPIIIDNIQ